MRVEGRAAGQGTDDQDRAASLPPTLPISPARVTSQRVAPNPAVDSHKAWWRGWGASEPGHGPPGTPVSFLRVCRGATVSVSCSPADHRVFPGADKVPAETH